MWSHQGRKLESPPPAGEEVNTVPEPQPPAPSLLPSMDQLPNAGPRQPLAHPNTHSSAHHHPLHSALKLWQKPSPSSGPSLSIFHGFSRTPSLWPPDLEALSLLSGPPDTLGLLPLSQSPPLTHSCSHPHIPELPSSITHQPAQGTSVLDTQAGSSETSHHKPISMTPSQVLTPSFLP